MTRGKLLLMGAVLALAVLVGGIGCTPVEAQALQGTLQNVDSVSGNVTVKLKDGSTETFNFNDVKVDTIRQALGNASLEVGDQVTVKANKDGKVEEVDAENAEVQGVIKNLGTDNVTITTNKKGDITLNITPETIIHIAGERNSAFSDLQEGQKVEAKYEVTNKNALRINVDNGKNKKENEDND